MLCFNALEAEICSNMELGGVLVLYRQRSGINPVYRWQWQAWNSLPNMILWGQSVAQRWPTFWFVLDAWTWKLKKGAGSRSLNGIIDNMGMGMCRHCWTWVTRFGWRVLVSGGLCSRQTTALNSCSATCAARALSDWNVTSDLCSFES